MSNGRIALVVLLILCVVALATGAALARHSLNTSQAHPAAAVTTPSSANSGRCHSSNGLPDPVCTPGAIDPRVKQDNIQSTICVSGHTTKVRPSTDYTNALKRRQIVEYGYTDTNLADYEEDHLIPLELGGSPTDPKNLWPEPRNGSNPASKKDGVENSLHIKVCAGLVSLAIAQVSIATNWESAA